MSDYYRVNVSELKKLLEDARSDSMSVEELSNHLMDIVEEPRYYLVTTGEHFYKMVEYGTYKEAEVAGDKSLIEYAIVEGLLLEGLCDSPKVLPWTTEKLLYWERTYFNAANPSDYIEVSWADFRDNYEECCICNHWDNGSDPCSHLGD